MFKKVAFTMYPVTDMARARRFYEETLGLGEAKVYGPEMWIEFDLPGGGCLALTTYGEQTPSNAAGGTIAFEVEDIDALCAELEGKGVTFASDMIHSPVCRMRVIIDTEGNGILLHQLKPKG